MLQNAIYSVISPEGCATILWRDPKKTLEAARDMKLSAKDLLELKIIDEIILEPIGGAHRDKNLILDNVRHSIKKNLNQFNSMGRDEILNHRKNKFLSIGRSKGFANQSSINVENLSMKQNFFDNIFSKIIKYKDKLMILLPILIILSFIFYLY